MVRLLLALLPANLLYEFGTGRALDNARRDGEELARMRAVVDALSGRVEATVVAVALEKERVAA